jgi:exopolyphosphatase/guanosine-5'-triphosphate,3'-diphosphate pyrophosphatase
VRLAAIDLGTVTARLLIADVDGSDIHELERHMRITHLGENLDETGVIGDAATKRECAACADFLKAINGIQRLDGRPVERVIAVASSAMRDAYNSREVCAAILASGLKVDVITGEREAQMSFVGTVSGFMADAALVGQTVLTVDVGGGSTELILGVMAEKSRASRMLNEHSFDIGCRRVTDRFLRDDPPVAEDISCARAWIKSEMQGYLDGLERRPQTMIAVAGTATSVVSIREAMSSYDPWRVHGSIVTLKDINKVLYNLAKLNLEARKQVVGLEPGRASVILGGLITLQAVLELVGLDSFIVSETDILQGILLDA